MTKSKTDPSSQQNQSLPLTSNGLLMVGPTPDGFEAQLAADVMADVCQDKQRTPAMIFVARDDKHMNSIQQSLRFFMGETPVLTFPAWDCLPYDRVSPQKELVGQRLTTLAQLARVDFSALKNPGLIVLTSINALLQRTVPKSAIADASFEASIGDDLDQDKFSRFLTS
ncbi:MAG: hypothetical protein ACPGVN_09615, partial [Alphaproteobacteria bacterium]